MNSELDCTPETEGSIDCGPLISSKHANDEFLHSKKIHPLVYFWIIVPVIDLIAGFGNMHSWSKYFDATSVP